MNLIHREFPNAEHPFLRHQFGVNSQRKARLPVYQDKLDSNGQVTKDKDGKIVVELISYKKEQEMVTIFHLLGWGEDEAEAKAMALDSLTFASASRIAVELAYEQSNRNVAGTARILDIREHRAHRLLEKFGFRKASKK